MIGKRASAILKFLTLVGCGLSTVYAHSPTSENASCARVASPVLLSNRATIDAQTRLYKIEADQVTRVTAYDLNTRDGRIGSVVWQSQLPITSSQAIASSAAASLDAVFIGPPRPRRAKQAEDSSYLRFAQAWTKRVPTLYVAAHDGRLYAVNSHTGQSAQIKVDRTGDTVGSQLATATILIGTEWRTVLVALSKASPSALHAIDASDPSQPTILWSQTIEISTSPERTHRPVLVRLNQASAVMLAAGDALHIYDAASGKKLRQIAIDSNTATLTDPLAVDLDLDGKSERVYAGDSQGNVWRFDLSSADPEQWQLAFDGRPLLTVTDDDGGTAHIFERPAIALSNHTRMPIVLFAAHSAGGLGFFGFYDLDKPVTASTDSWSTHLASTNATHTVSKPRVHGGEVIYTLATQTKGASCHTSVKRLLAFSIEDGTQRMPTSPSGIEEVQDQDMRIPVPRGPATTPEILDQLTPTGDCARHYYLGLDESIGDDAGVLHETRNCPADTFGRQSWRQLR